ncbi:MAG: hypothetical protein OXD46_11775 [Chloroflexi bacterium]|nr:hypothetical protein [Chloroflexota bacterium]
MLNESCFGFSFVFVPTVYPKDRRGTITIADCRRRSVESLIAREFVELGNITLDDLD